MKFLFLLFTVDVASASLPEVDNVLTNADIQLLQAALNVETKPVVAMDDKVKVKTAVTTTSAECPSGYTVVGDNCYQAHASEDMDVCEGVPEQQSCDPVPSFCSDGSSLATQNQMREWLTIGGNAPLKTYGVCSDVRQRPYGPEYRLYRYGWGHVHCCSRNRWFLCVKPKAVCPPGYTAVGSNCYQAHASQDMDVCQNVPEQQSCDPVPSFCSDGSSLATQNQMREWLTIGGNAPLKTYGVCSDVRQQPYGPEYRLYRYGWGHVHCCARNRWFLCVKPQA